MGGQSVGRSHLKKPSPLAALFASSSLPNVVELIMDDGMTGPPAIRIEIKKSSFSCGRDAE